MRSDADRSGGAVPARGGRAAGADVARFLAFAATPVFATMAALAAAADTDPATALCSATMPPLGPNGMVAMYGLMSAIHSAPWLTLMLTRLTREAHVDRPAPAVLDGG